MDYPDIALQVPEILLPGKDVELDRWAVIACDQYTSQPEYWERVRREVGDRPSALNLVFPEAHLDRSDRGERIGGIDREMRAYLDRGLLDQLVRGFVLVDRQTPRAVSRKGLLVALDLEHYDYRRDSNSLIRPTEATVVSRLPPRIEIRRGASLELPHVMVLIDDPGRTVIDPLFNGVSDPLYDVELMQGGGRVRGWLLEDHGSRDRVAESLRRLVPVEPTGAILYALGDGNHSFAAAKEVWEGIKRESSEDADIYQHPARHVLVELVNVHDDGMELAPIHRLVNSDAGTTGEELLDRLVRRMQEQGMAVEITDFNGQVSTGGSFQELPFLTECRQGVLRLPAPAGLQVVALAGIVDAYCNASEDLQLDYIHGDEALNALASRPGNIGFLAAAIDKADLFPTILRDGPLPSKSFSMGEAEEKRYYLEARRIRRPRLNEPEVLD